jgi:hypothetical protein
MNRPDGESFTALLKEKLTELDLAAAAEDALIDDPVEQLRQRAALLVTRIEGRAWLTGPAVQYQPDVPPPEQVHALDIRFPARIEASVVAPGNGAPVAGRGVVRGVQRGAPRQGRRIPQQGTPSQ